MKLSTPNAAQLLLMKFIDCYNRKDLPGLLHLFCKKAHLWGTGVDEYRMGIEQIEEQIKRDWQQSDDVKIQIVTFVPSAPEALWAAIECKTTITVHGKEHHFENLRGSIMLEKEDGEWKIAHFHSSFPDVRNPENSSFPIL